MNSADLTYYGKQFAHHGIDIAMPRNQFITAVSCGLGYWASRSCRLWCPGFFANMAVRASPFIAEENSKWESLTYYVNHYGWAVWTGAVEVSDQTVALVGVGTAVAVSITLNLIAMAIFGTKKPSEDSPHPLTQLVDLQSTTNESDVESQTPAKGISYNATTRRPDSDDDAFRELVGFDPMAGVARCWHPCR